MVLPTSTLVPVVLGAHPPPLVETHGSIAQPIQHPAQQVLVFWQKVAALHQAVLAALVAHQAHQLATQFSQAVMVAQRWQTRLNAVVVALLVPVV